MLPKEIILQSIRREYGRAAGAKVVGARGPRLYDLEAKEKLFKVFEGPRKNVFSYSIFVPRPPNPKTSRALPA